MQLSTSCRMRPNVCIRVSLSKVSSGRAVRKRRMPARSGDCTSDLKRLSRSGASGRWLPEVGAPRGEGHIIHGRPRRPLAGRRTRDGAGRAVILRLVLLDELLHAHGVGLAMAVAGHGRGSAARLDQHVREQQVGVDAHRCHMRDMYRMFFSADEFRGVVDDRRRRDQYLGRKQPVAARPPAGAKHVAVGEWPAFPPEEHDQGDGDRGQHTRRRDPRALCHALMLP